MDILSISDLYTSERKQLLLSLFEGKKVSVGPKSAFEAIQARACTIPHVTGLNVDGIVQLRSKIHGVNPKLENGAAIMAPHTHWVPGEIIIERYDPKEDWYLLGVHAVEDIREPLVPISFVFNSDGPPIAYEWADASSNLSLEEVLEFCEYVALLNDDIRPSFDWPLGISLLHRFKRSSIWELQTDIIVEVGRTIDGQLFGASIPQERISADENEVFYQVAWHAIYQEQSAEQQAAIKSLLDVLVQLPEDQQQEFLIQLGVQLGE